MGLFNMKKYEKKINAWVKEYEKRMNSIEERLQFGFTALFERLNRIDNTLVAIDASVYQIRESDRISKKARVLNDEKIAIIMSEMVTLRSCTTFLLCEIMRLESDTSEEERDRRIEKYLKIARESGFTTDIKFPYNEFCNTEEKNGIEPGCN